MRAGYNGPRRDWRVALDTLAGHSTTIIASQSDNSFFGKIACSIASKGFHTLCAALTRRDFLLAPVSRRSVVFSRHKNKNFNR
jgi:hypothetical protein